jgi:DNA adenine methylase
MSQSKSYEKPIIKWVGGKTQIIEKVIEKFPKEINNYHELFLGGGSVLIALLQNIENKTIKLNGNINAYDINETLIHLYKNIQSNLDKVISEINKIIKELWQLIYKGIIK